ncbi:MAG: hypothetical protein HY097_01835 [Nitrospinae bacterium]|nr:hypothetical protein [Nitrospinota bacterium]MBI3815158.1 hypothetical protein [Nitrospinota bacterium]
MKKRETKGERIFLRMSDKEKGEVTKKAKSLGLSLSAYIMMLIYKDNPSLGGRNR